MKYNTLLIIAGSDPSGGAGVQADIKTATAIGAYATTAITSITVQNTMGVKSATALSAQLVGEQIDAVCQDIDIDAFKIGMLANAEIVNVVADKLAEYNAKNVVLDPVMVSTSGHKLLDDSAVECLIKRLIPLATLITPNIPEAEVLLGYKVNCANFELAAKDLCQRYNCNVLLKGGHREDNIMRDCLIIKSDCRLYNIDNQYIDTKNTHGTGCTLSSAITSYLSKGYALIEACKSGKEYLFNALKSGADYEIGHGHGPVNHNY